MTSFPPVTPYTSPVTKRDSFDARNTNTGAISTGCAARSNEVSCPNFSTFSFGIVDGMRGVHTGPGATAFTRTPRSMAICDSAFVKLMIAAFVGA